VTTEHGTYFVAIGLGALELDGERCYIISLASPLGQALRGKRSGETITFNGERRTIISVQ
jgi:transcription elongation GreA/GreB family factor